MYETPVRFFSAPLRPANIYFRLCNLSRHIYLKNFKHALEWLFDNSLNYGPYLDGKWVRLAGMSRESTLISSRFRATFLSFLSNCRRMLAVRIKDNAGVEASGLSTPPPGCLWGAL